MCVGGKRHKIITKIVTTNNPDAGEVYVTHMDDDETVTIITKLEIFTWLAIYPGEKKSLTTTNLESQVISFVSTT